MAAERRIVRVSISFFDQLDEQLSTERSAAGEPSATDFVVSELPAVIERFAIRARQRRGGGGATISNPEHPAAASLVSRGAGAAQLGPWRRRSSEDDEVTWG